MPRKRKWNPEDLPKIVAGSHSVREVIGKLGLIPAGGNYQQVQKTIDEMSIDTSHFTGKGWRKNKKFVFVVFPDFTRFMKYH